MEIILINSQEIMLVQGGGLCHPRGLTLQSVLNLPRLPLPLSATPFSFWRLFSWSLSPWSAHVITISLFNLMVFIKKKKTFKKFYQVPSPAWPLFCSDFLSLRLYPRSFLMCLFWNRDFRATVLGSNPDIAVF